MSDFHGFSGLGIETSQLATVVTEVRSPGTMSFLDVFALVILFVLAAAAVAV